MNTYTLNFSELQMTFLRQLVQSDLAVTFSAAKIAASIQDAILNAQPDVLADGTFKEATPARASG